ncbi:retrotransposon protein, putative, ty1-copia subclass, partial [Tanacetum coccineum]
MPPNQEHVHLDWPLWSDLRVIPTHGNYGFLHEESRKTKRKNRIRLLRESRKGIATESGNALYASPSFAPKPKNPTTPKTGLHQAKDTSGHQCGEVAKLNLDSALLWHCRLGHISKKRIEKLQHDGLLDSTDIKSFEKCVSCMSGKMARKPYSQPQMDRAKIYLDLPTKHDKEKNQFGKTIKSLRSNCGGEYMSQEFLDHLKDHGIIAHITPPYTPQMNGVSERRNRTLLDMVRSMMSQTTLPKSFWDYAESAARILNMVPTKKVHKTPYENSLINQEASGSLKDLEIIQEEDTHPSVDTSLYHDEDRKCVIHRSCEEEHELGDLCEPAKYKAALLDPESDILANGLESASATLVVNKEFVPPLDMYSIEYHRPSPEISRIYCMASAKRSDPFHCVLVAKLVTQFVKSQQKASKRIVLVCNGSSQASSSNGDDTSMDMLRTIQVQEAADCLGADCESINASCLQSGWINEFEDELLTEIWGQSGTTWRSLLDELSNESEPENVVVSVGHPIMNIGLLGHCLNLTKDWMGSFHLDASSMSVIDFPDGPYGRGVVRCINYTLHLGRAREMLKGRFKGVLISSFLLTKARPKLGLPGESLLMILSIFVSL